MPTAGLVKDQGTQRRRTLVCVGCVCERMGQAETRPEGLLVVSVSPKSPGANAGLVPWLDTVTHASGEELM